MDRTTIEKLKPSGLHLLEFPEQIIPPKELEKIAPRLKQIYDVVNDRNGETTWAYRRELMILLAMSYIVIPAIKLPLVGYVMIPESWKRYILGKLFDFINGLIT